MEISSTMFSVCSASRNLGKPRRTFPSRRRIGMPTSETASDSVGSPRNREPPRSVETQVFSALHRNGEWIAKVATVFQDGSTQVYECEHRDSRRKALQDIERIILTEAYPDPPDL